METRERDSPIQAKIRSAKDLIAIKNFSEFDKRVPTMRKVAKMNRSKLFSSLTRIPSSIFFRCKTTELESVLTYNVAVEYFALLCMVNDRDRSDLHIVDELGSSIEESRHSS